MSLFYEDFEIGKQFESKPRKVLQEDIRTFAELTGDLNKLHLDEEYAKKTVFRGRIAHGMLTLSISLGLWYAMDITRSSIIAFIGVNNLSFKAPVYPGDEIHLLSEIISKRESKSRPGAGIVTFQDTMLNSRGEIVMESERTLMLRKKQ